MAGSGPNGEITPLDPIPGKDNSAIYNLKSKMKAKAKQKAKRSHKLADIPLSESLQKMRVTPKKLASGQYQQKLIAFFAQHISPEFFNAVRRGVVDGDSNSLKLW